MYWHSNNEYVDMYLIFGEAHCSSVRAERLYAKRYPNCMHPDRKTFERLDQRIRNSDCLIPKLIDVGRNRLCTKY